MQPMNVTLQVVAIGNSAARSSVSLIFSSATSRCASSLPISVILAYFQNKTSNWDWLRNLIRRRQFHTNNRNLHVLNLFGYTGGSTLSASQAGAHVVHVDAAKGVVDWARRNTEMSRLHERPIRWLVDDALKFVKREARRTNRYQGIILDPPSFGRGPKGEVFKIEDDLLPLLDECRTLLADDALFILYSGHTPGFTPLVMNNQLAAIVPKDGQIEHGEMVIVDQQGRALPSGTYARWSATEKTQEKKAEKSTEKSIGKTSAKTSA